MPCTSADFICKPDFAVYQIGFNTRWTPVKGLTFTGEVQYVRLDQNFSGTAVSDRYSRSEFDARLPE